MQTGGHACMHGALLDHNLQLYTNCQSKFGGSHPQFMSYVHDVHSRLTVSLYVTACSGKGLAVYDCT